MAVLTHTVHPPGSIGYIPEPEGIGRVLMGYGIIMAVLTRIRNGEVRGRIARWIIAR